MRLSTRWITSPALRYSNLLPVVVVISACAATSGVPPTDDSDPAGETLVERDPVDGRAPPELVLTDDDLALARRILPDGDRLTDREIAERVRTAELNPDAPKLKPPVRTEPAALPTREQLRERALARGGENDSIRVTVSVGELEPRDGRLEFDGAVRMFEDGQLTIIDTAAKAELSIDFVEMPNLQLPRFDRDTAIRGLLMQEQSPLGQSLGMVLRDRSGLKFVVSKNLGRDILGVEDLYGLQLRQSDVVDPGFTNRCAEVTYPRVEVWAVGGDRMLIRHGGRNIYYVDDQAYMVEIITSRRTIELPCGDYLEEPPRELEYVIRRIDSREEIELFDASFDAVRDSAVEPDPPGRHPDTGDGPPNPKLQDDRPPVSER